MTATRRPLPAQRHSVTHETSLTGDNGSVKVYLTIGYFEDGTPGEVFLMSSKAGTFVRGLFDSIAILISLALQTGSTPEAIADMLASLCFEPNHTTDPDNRQVASVVDWVGRVLVAESP